MGAGASLASAPDRIDKEAAKALAGDAFDEAVFDMAAADGTVSRTQFEAAASRNLERAIVAALSAARSKPKLVATRLQARLQHFKGTDYFPPERGGKVAVATKEGPAAIKDALAYLAVLAPLQGLAEPAAANDLDAMVLAAADHLHDRGSLGAIGHEGADGSSSSDRLSRYGAWSRACGECLWFGREGASAESVVDDLIIDDNVKGRGHRQCIFDERYRLAVAKVGSHKVFGSMAVIEFAAEYAGDAGMVAARARAGPPALPPSGAGGKGAVPKKGQATQWKSLGTCAGCGQPIEGGAVMEVEKLGKFHKACFQCAECTKPLVGVPFKAEKGVPRCAECHAQLFSPDCAACGKKITGAGVSINGVKYHRECKPSSSGAGSSGAAAGKTTVKRSLAKPAKTSAVKPAKPSMGGAKNHMDGLMGDYANM